MLQSSRSNHWPMNGLMSLKSGAPRYTPYTAKLAIGQDYLHPFFFFFFSSDSFTLFQVLRIFRIRGKIRFLSSPHPVHPLESNRHVCPCTTPCSPPPLSASSLSPSPSWAMMR
ncbi:hypothetical protein LY78DRAFT_434714 [Colletotrichum sublineola]|nr:hypothetical protein LY78DRAFT_434714 [Colletotrichum sublineola]